MDDLLTSYIRYTHICEFENLLNFRFFVQFDVDCYQQGSSPWHCWDQTTGAGGSNQRSEFRGQSSRGGVSRKI